MDRRTLLKSTLSTTLSAGLLTAADDAIGAQAAPARAMPDAGDFIETATGVKLAFTDWGAGRPVVFIHAWALPSAMWDYQISALCEKGCGASRMTAADMAAPASQGPAMIAIRSPTISPHC